jgi:antitoxin (DNA-binding transcriptional repressor) of toxin-antitoxin stability system
VVRVPDEVTIHEAKTHLSRLVHRAHEGEEIVIRRGRVPMAKLVRYEAEPVPRSPGRLRGQIELGDDFDDAMSDELGDLFGLPR